MKILTKIAGILLLLPIVAGYAQLLPSLSLGSFTEKLNLNLAEPSAVDLVPADFGDVETDEPNIAVGQTGITPEEALATAEAAYPGAKTLAMENDRVNNGNSLIYTVELDNGIYVEVDARNGNILGTEYR